MPSLPQRIHTVPEVAPARGLPLLGHLLAHCTRFKRSQVQEGQVTGPAEPVSDERSRPEHSGLGSWKARSRSAFERRCHNSSPNTEIEKRHGSPGRDERSVGERLCHTSPPNSEIEERHGSPGRDERSVGERRLCHTSPPNSEIEERHGSPGRDEDRAVEGSVTPLHRTVRSRSATGPPGATKFGRWKALSHLSTEQ